MSLTYDGIIHRSLEEQIIYNAEQVQLLKQADVTINENLQTVNESLQTVNTEVNSKLTKPTNPSAESAVTMLADGTVGTKLLSEIGGGKLYVHSIFIDTNDFNLKIDLYKSDNSEINTIDKLFDALNGFPGIPCHYISYRDNNHGFVEVSMTGQPGVHALTVIGVVANLSGQVNAVNMSNVNTTTIRDTVLEV